MNYQRFFLIAAAGLGLLAVLIGAFGAHSMSRLLAPGEYAQAIKPFQTGVDYHFYHTLALLLTALLPSNRLSMLAGAAFITGIILFSGSLYMMSVTGIRGLGIITPFGGLLFILGWLFLIIYGWKQNQHPQ